MFWTSVYLLHLGRALCGQIIMPVLTLCTIATGPGDPLAQFIVQTHVIAVWCGTLVLITEAKLGVLVDITLPVGLHAVMAWAQLVFCAILDPAAVFVTVD
jgi:hypothetical protein